MSVSPGRIFGLLTMLALALLTFWLDRVAHEGEQRPAAFRRHDPDYSIDNFTVTSYDSNGRPESTLSAAKMVHYPDDDSTELVSPQVVYSRVNRPRVSVRADRGELSQDGEEIFFFGNVLLSRDAGDDSGAMSVHTEFLHVVRARALVRTDRAVEVDEAGRASLSGNGMLYDNDKRTLVLYGPVRARFEPRRSTP